MSLKELNTLVVEDDADMQEILLRKLRWIVSKEKIQLAWNFEEAQGKIETLKKAWAEKLILILDGQFPYSETEPKPHYMWRELLEYIMGEFWPEFLLYLIPFSWDMDTHHYMHDENQNNPRIKVITWKKIKNSDRVIEGIKGIS